VVYNYGALILVLQILLWNSWKIYNILQLHILSEFINQYGYEQRSVYERNLLFHLPWNKIIR
jgi:hypothetical protein